MSERRHRPPWLDITILVSAVLVFVALVALGNWQMRRLDWKQELIATIEARAHQPPAAPPEGSVSQEDHAYQRVMLAGDFRHELALRVKAVTELGPSHWLMTPLDTGERHVWINRGFLPSGLADDAILTPPGRRPVVGLLRIAEPGGTLLERNRPDADYWVSRDLALMSATAGLARSAPFFVDAAHDGPVDSWPRGGLTRLTFRDSHLAYALTWYALAVLLLAGMAYAVHDRLRSSRSET